jgi:hypothetical protein
VAHDGSRALPAIGRDRAYRRLGPRRSQRADRQRKKSNPVGRNPEDEIAKIFRLHRDPLFKELVERPQYVSIAQELLGGELDCFDSAFIFKNLVALGQPWHQDSYYFAFDRAPQIGFWLAISEVTLNNAPQRRAGSGSTNGSEALIRTAFAASVEVCVAKPG